jgi:hypothetical protein
MCLNLQGHGQSPWQIHTENQNGKGAGDMAQAVECHFAGIKSWVQIPVQPKTKKIFGAEEVAQWESVCPACVRFWIQFPNIAKKKKNGEEDKWL